ncbi:DUF1214 domain-containing protein [Streptomyces sp. NPDC057403]|uniref:DUF1214 domain-containing protein n=1 Tax=Streptomyces sp. NPDC057403 TaxID=3346119 RepID=UPI0036BD539A
MVRGRGGPWSTGRPLPRTERSLAAHRPDLSPGHGVDLHPRAGRDPPGHAGIPAGCAHTRSLLRTDHPYPSVNNQSEGVRAESNGDMVIHFGPTAPEGREANWIETAPGKGLFVMLRLYGPLESWFDKS